jgi:hypothetical protein
MAFTVCHWDAVDGRCEHNVPTGPMTGCYSIFSAFTCSTTPGCIWDVQQPGGPRCEPLGI